MCRLNHLCYKYLLDTCLKPFWILFLITNCYKIQALQEPVFFVVITGPAFYVSPYISIRHNQLDQLFFLTCVQNDHDISYLSILFVTKLVCRIKELIFFLFLLQFLPRTDLLFQLADLINFPLF